MPKTVANQRTIYIHRERVTTDFLGIKKENWYAASRTLGAHALRLYLYLASNANNYELALSAAAIEEAIGMPRSTYHDQFKKLVSQGYLVERSSNHYDFYEVPQTAPRTEEKQSNPAVVEIPETETKVVYVNPQGVHRKTAQHTEINNTEMKNNIIDNMQEKQVSPAIKEFVFDF